MIITHHVSKCNFLSIFVLILLLEILIAILMIALYQIYLQKITLDLENVVKTLNEEILQTFYNDFNEEQNKYSKDLIYIAKHIAMFDQMKPELGIINDESSFYKSFEKKCLVKEEEFGVLKINPAYTDYLDYLMSNYAQTGNTNPIELLLKNDKIFPKGISSYSNEEITDILMNLPSLDKIVYYNDDNTVLEVPMMCYIKIILKTLLIKHILQRKNYTSLINYYIFDENNFFGYPLNELNKNTLKYYGVFESESGEIKIKYGHEYYLLDQNPNESLSQSKALFGNWFVIDVCLIVATKKELIQGKYKICLTYQIGNVYKSISLSNDNFQYYVIFNREIDGQEDYFEYETYCLFDQKAILKEYFNIDIVPSYYRITTNDGYYLLFHRLYFEIFQYKKDVLTNQDLENLIKEYQEILRNITDSINIIDADSSKTNETLFIKQSFLHYQYNESGILDINNGIIKQDIFIYLVSHPIYDSIIYDENFMIHENRKRRSFANLAIYRLTTNTRYQNLNEKFNYKVLKTMGFFIMLLIVTLVPYWMLFRCFVNLTFSPIEEIYKNMTQKCNKANYISNEYKLVLNGYDSFSPNLKHFCQFFLLLENLILIRQENNDYQSIDKSFLNEMFSSLTDPLSKITYGAFITSYFFKNKLYYDCKKTIKQFNTCLEEELQRLKEENEHIEKQIEQIFSSKPYINDFTNMQALFNDNNQLYTYYKLSSLSSRLSFMYGICQCILIKEKLEEDQNEVFEKDNNSNSETKDNNQKTERKKYESSSIKNDKLIIIDKEKKRIKEREIKLRERSNKAISLFNQSFDICEKYNYNKIHKIILLMYIGKCYITQKCYVDALINCKEALVLFLEFNDILIEHEKAKHQNLEVNIMLIINSAIIEELIYLIGIIPNKAHTILFSPPNITLLHKGIIMSPYKTDFIQGKISKLFSNIINNYITKNKTRKNTKYKQLYNLAEPKLLLQETLMSKMHKRLQDQSKSKLRKRIIITVSPSLLNVLPSHIELIQVIYRSITKYCNKHDIISCFMFNQSYDTIHMYDVCDFKYENLLQVIHNSNVIEYGMQTSLETAFTLFDNQDDDVMNTQFDDNDDYIFQFMLGRDYKFQTPNQRKEIRDTINKQCISVYTFLFGLDVVKDQKIDRIENNIRKNCEGVLIDMKTMNVIKSVFRNISNQPSKQNLFNNDLSVMKNIHYYFHQIYQ